MTFETDFKEPRLIAPETQWPARRRPKDEQQSQVGASERVPTENLTHDRHSNNLEIEEE